MESASCEPHCLRRSSEESLRQTQGSLNCFAKSHPECTPEQSTCLVKDHLLNMPWTPDRLRK